MGGQLRGLSFAVVNKDLLRELSFAVANEDLLRDAAFWQIRGRIFDVVAGGGCGLVGRGL